MNNPKPDILHVKREAAQGYHMRYNREERLMMKAASNDREKIKRQRRRKVGTVLYIILGVAIAALCFIMLYKYVL